MALLAANARANTDPPGVSELGRSLGQWRTADAGAEADFSGVRDRCIEGGFGKPQICRVCNLHSGDPLQNIDETPPDVAPPLSAPHAVSRAEALSWRGGASRHFSLAGIRIIQYFVRDVKTFFL